MEMVEALIDKGVDVNAVNMVRLIWRLGLRLTATDQ